LQVVSPSASQQHSARLGPRLRAAFAQAQDVIPIGAIDLRVALRRT
jgi:hypothetical protein